MATGRIHVQRSSMSTTPKSYVSIQLPLGGHSFSRADLDKIVADAESHMVATLHTAKCVAVPAEVFRKEDCASYLASSAIAVESNECVVYSNTEQPIVAVMVVNKECHELLSTSYGTRLHYTTPLLLTPAPEQGTVLHLNAGVLYIRVVNDGLRLAEVIQVTNDADILYYLERTHRAFNIYNMYARAEGETQRLMSIGKKIFTKIVCE